VLNIHIEGETPILKLAALHEELAKVVDGTNTIEIRECLRNEMLRAQARIR
jgi:hypothetical protein